MLSIRFEGKKRQHYTALSFQAKAKERNCDCLSNILPCHATLLFQKEKANYVVKLFKMAEIAMVDTPSPIGYGWDGESGIQWIEEMLPV